MHRYLRGTFLLNFPILVHAVVALVTLPIVLRSVPAGDFGKWQFVLAMQVWIFAITADNITRATKRGIAQGLSGTLLYGFLTRMKLVAPVSILLIFVALLVQRVGDDTVAMLLVILAGYLLFGYLFQVSYFEFLVAKKKFREWSFWHIVISVVSLGSSSAAAYLTKDVLYFALLYFGSISIACVFLWLFLAWREAIFTQYGEGAIDKACVPYGLKLIFVELVNATASKLPYIYIVPYFGYANLAFFAVADKLRERAGGIMKSIRSLLYADFARAQRKDVVQLVGRNLTKVGCIGLLFALLFLTSAWFYIRYFLPSGFLISFKYFVILSFGIPAIMMAVVLHTFLESHLRYKELTVIGVIPNVIKIMLILLCGYLGGIIGICIALAISTWLTFMFYYVLTVRYDDVYRLLIKVPLFVKLSNF